MDGGLGAAPWDSPGKDAEGRGKSCSGGCSGIWARRCHSSTGYISPGLAGVVNRQSPCPVDGRVGLGVEGTPCSPWGCLLIEPTTRYLFPSGPIAASDQGPLPGGTCGRTAATCPGGHVCHQGTCPVWVALGEQGCVGCKG